MSNDTEGKQSSDLYALLIGIDHYPPHTLPGGGYYPKLRGCVADVERVEAFLQAELGLTKDRLVKLTATNVVAEEPPEPKAQWPTYENMVAAFQQVTELAGEGDQVYVHYSGHGGRAPTIYPELKGEEATDEGLVPMDIGREDARYLRDLELAYLFQQMVDKGLRLFVVFDSCHSGGTTRAVDVAVRGIAEIDTTPRPTDSLVAPREELADNWNRVTRGQARALKPGGGWLPAPTGYTLLTACRSEQYAHEYEVESGKWGGVLTYWMLVSLKPLRPGFSYRMLRNQVVPKVHTLFPHQTPQLQGLDSRTVFGRETVPPVQTVSILRVDDAAEKIQLGAGQVHAVAIGAQFAVYPEGTTDFRQMEKRRGLVEVTELGAASSWAKVVKQFDQGHMREGDQAILIDPGKYRLKRRVRLFRYEVGELPPTVDQDTALWKVQAALEAEPTGWVGLAGEGQEVDYEVSVNAASEYEISDRSGKPIDNLRPALKIDDARAADGVVQRLVHLTKYHNLLLLENQDRTSPVARGLEVEILRAQPGFEPGDPLEPQPFGDTSAAPGDWLVARVTNRSSQDLNVAVFDLSPDWGITQVHPTWTEHIPLDPGAEESFILRAGLPEGYEEGTDVLKAFAALDAVGFRWLELPSLDNAPTRRAMITRSTEEGDALEQMLAAFAVDQPKTRSISVAEYPSRGWVTTQVELRIKVQHPEEQVEVLNQRAMELYATGDHAQATILAEQAVKQARQQLGAGHPIVATSMAILGKLAEARQDWEEAGAHYQKSLDTLRAALGEDHPEVADRLSDLARIRWMLGDHKSAEQLYETALDIHRSALGEESSPVAADLSNLALLYRSLGHYVRSMPLAEQALEIRQGVLGNTHPDVGHSLFVLAEIHRKLGDHMTAEPLYQRALDLWRQLRYLTEEGWTLEALAQSCVSQDRLPQALAYLERASEIKRELRDDIGEAEVWNARAAVHRLMGQYSEALNCCRAALHTADEAVAVDDLARAATLHNLATVYSELGEYAEAVDRYQEAVALREQGEDLEGVVETLCSLGDTHLREGHHQPALEVFQRALKARRSSVEDTHPAVAASFRDLARCYHRMGDLARAEKLLQRALTIQRDALGGDHPVVAQTLNDLARLLAAAGRPRDAYDAVLRAAAIDDRTIELFVPCGYDRRRAAYLKRVEQDFEMVLSLVVAHFADSPSITREAFDLVLRRKGLFAELLAAPRDRPMAHRYPDLAESLRMLTNHCLQLIQAYLSDPTRLDYKVEVHSAERSEWLTQKDELELNLIGYVPELEFTRYVRGANRYEVAAALPRDAALIEFVKFQPWPFHGADKGEDRKAHYLAFVLVDRQPDSARLLNVGNVGGEADIDRWAAAYKSLIASPTARRRSYQQAQLLEEVLLNLVSEVQREALGARRYLVLSPAGELCGLPFATLPGPNGSYLIDAYHFSYLPAGRDVLRFAARVHAPSFEPLVIGAPDFDLGVGSEAGESRLPRQLGDPSGYLPRFPAMRAEWQEVEEVAALLSVNPWLGDRALTSSLRNFRSPGMLHLVTKGFFLPTPPADRGRGSLDGRQERWQGSSLVWQMVAGENPLLRSGLAMAGANTWLDGGSLPPEEETGLLTSNDISGLDLSGTELVALTASHGSGELSGTGAAVGALQRAVLLAGAKSLVMDLFPVPELQTRELMVDFYKGVLSGLSHAAALRAAQLSLKAKYPAPFYWGAFVCLGDLSPLVEEKPFERAVNRYMVGLPATGEFFVGRHDILRIIEDNLAPGAAGNILVLRGARRTGKTSVLHRLKDTLPQQEDNLNLPVLIDLQGMDRIQNESDFLYNMAYFMEEELLIQDVEIRPAEEGDFNSKPTIAFDRFLGRVLRTLGQRRRLFLMIDEFDKMGEWIESGHLRSQILEYLRHLMQHRPVLFLLAGTHRLREFTGGYWSVFFNLAVPIDIGAMSPRDARTLIVSPVQPWYTIQPPAVDEIVRVAGCHPYFTQLVCKELLEIRNEYRVNSVDLTHVREAVDKALRTGEENIGFPWTREGDCTSGERLVLSLMAQLGKKNKPIPMSVIKEHLAGAGLERDVAPIVERLLVRDVLTEDPQGRLTFVVPLFQLWLARQGYDTLGSAAEYNQLAEAIP